MNSASSEADFLRILTRKNRSSWNDPSFWRKLCPDLTVSDQVCDGNEAQETKVSTEASRRRERLKEDGYCLIDDMGADGIMDKKLRASLVQKLATSITRLHKNHAFPATFILLYDEVWHMARAASRVLSSSSDPANKFNFDCLAWYIDPREGMSGFSPHRDRQPQPPVAPKDTFHQNGMAMYVTMWLALTDATPENSCLYVIPAKFDPGYIEGDDEDASNDGTIINIDEKRTCQSLDPLARALRTKESYQNIRALPRLAGQSVLFTHRILHWGSRGNPNSHLRTPRIAISFVSSDPRFEKPYIDVSLEENIPPFPIRLLLVCAQLLIYYQRFDLPKECIKACYDYCKEHGKMLEESYRKKVFCEFVKAMREDKSGKSAPAPNQDETSRAVADCSDEDDEDAILDEMLDAEAGGYGDFQDDYDEFDDEDNKDEHIASEDEAFDDSENGPGILFRKRESPPDLGEDGSAKGNNNKKRGRPV